jgi:hypothetical protein
MVPKLWPGLYPLKSYDFRNIEKVLGPPMGRKNFFGQIILQSTRLDERNSNLSCFLIKLKNKKVIAILVSLECVGTAEEYKNGLRSVRGRSAGTGRSSGRAEAEHTEESTLKCPPEQFQSVFPLRDSNFFIFAFYVKPITFS